MTSEGAPAFSRISIRNDPPLAYLTLNNPTANVIDIPMMDELQRALVEVEGRRDISVLIISGDGNTFSSGVDVAAHVPTHAEQMLLKFHSVIRRLRDTAKITISQVRGKCLGGAAELAMMCDLVYTAEDASWAFPEIKLGCYPPVAVTELAALIGQRAAADLTFTGRTITGTDAANLGLANRAVSEIELDDVVNETVSRLTNLSTAVLGLTKKAMRRCAVFEEKLKSAEQIYLEELIKMDDAREGIDAFLEKRPPKWSGK
ncbi:MAG: enoyl-CoA hydratase/isomerase family protein [Acidobacteriales bacterium]|nr:enoyl-CoA hydratase/isomerase family protein [Terriglobales bacterium]